MALEAAKLREQALQQTCTTHDDCPSILSCCQGKCSQECDGAAINRLNDASNGQNSLQFSLFVEDTETNIIIISSIAAVILICLCLIMRYVMPKTRRVQTG